jgi:hypothetical protein
MEIDKQEPTKEAVLVKVKDNLDTAEKRQRGAPKKKYLDVIKEATDPEAVFDEVMKQRIKVLEKVGAVCRAYRFL